MAEKLLYTAGAHVTGGRNGHGATTDGALDVDLRRPTEMGGEGGGTNPEQLFAVGYAACFKGALDVAGRRARIDVEDATIDSEVSLLTTADRAFSIAVSLSVHIPSLDDVAQAADLVRAAHEICPYSRATRGNVPVSLTVNGQHIDTTS
ncbi:MAG: organic hydroperoxide resistance protein [Solirubrobacteraceae bacterium]